jgi:membrane protease YdiL (CAAX protease family)
MGNAAADEVQGGNRVESEAQPSIRPAVWPAILAYVVAFLGVLAASLALVAVVAIERVPSLDPALIAAQVKAFALSAPGMFASAAIDAAVLGVVAVVAARLERGRVYARLRVGPSRATALGLGAAVVAMAGLSIAGSAVTELLGVRGDDVMDLIAHVLERPSASRFALSILCVSIAPGIAEETFFRGLLQPRLVARYGRWGGIVLTAISFGVFHVDLVQGTLACALGVLLGWMAERLGSIRPGILAHAVNNAFFVVAAGWGSQERGPPAAHVAFLAGGTVACVAGVLVLRSRRAVRE